MVARSDLWQTKVVSESIPVRALGKAGDPNLV